MPTNAKLFGLQIWPKRRSDTEYVDHVRKRLRAHRSHRYVSALISVITIGLAIWILQEIVKVLNNGLVLPGQQNFVQIGLAIGIVVGIGIGCGIGQAMHSVVMSFAGRRQEQLLVDCWDSLNRLLSERSSEVRPLQSLTDN